MSFAALFYRRRYYLSKCLVAGSLFCVACLILKNNKFGSPTKELGVYKGEGAYNPNTSKPRAEKTQTSYTASITTDAVVVTTAADSNFFYPLEELAASIQFWDPGTKIAVYDLGLSQSEISEIRSWCNVTLLPLPRDAPEHVLHGPRKQYAWKTPVISDAVHRFKTVLYIDAGSVVRGYLEPIKKLLVEDGHFFVQGQDIDMTIRLHSGMLSYFNQNRTIFQEKPSFSGNLQGYVLGSRTERAILTRLLVCSFNPSCITPLGSTIDNHRFDQSALSVLIYSSGLDIQPHTEYLASSAEQLSKDPTQPSEKIVWTARGSSNVYKIRICN